MLTYRSDEVSPELRHYLAEFDREHLAQDFSLQRFARADVDAMLQAIFAMHQAAHSGLVESMYAFTEGNPFFIEEVLKSLIATGEIASNDGVWERTLLFGTHKRHPSIPRSVQDVVYQRTKQLSVPARQVLTLAAVAGRRFDLTILRQVMHVDESHMLVLMKELVAAQFVVEEAVDQFSFRHALTRQAVYAELLAGERRALHRTIAETIEQHAFPSSILDAQLVDLAYHFYEGGIWSKAFEYGQRAGERALILFAPRAAIEHLTRALGALKHLASTPPATLFRARGQAFETVGEFEQARSDYEHALSIAQQTQDGIMEWQSLLDIGCLWAERDYAQAGHWFRRSLDRAQALADPKLHARSRNRVGNWLVNTGRAEEGLQAHQEALAIFEALQDSQDLAQRNFTSARQGLASLARTIDDVYLREHFLHAALATLPREKPVSVSRIAKEAFGGLTERERVVAAFIAQGKSNREIADELVVSYRTVETHVGTILSKLAFSSRAQIAVWAVEIGLVKQAE